ncbi:aldo/keto reductase [Lapidilactobacillus wuchangensis]|uniref:aldo/keto reductase n=1 Tax=Lapidilactobacillus wuchangensis TaxID=2486001 RepID=UPI000F780C05|nr:aldo/keto reductase [Lapidilactobacillus wuchangensis]
MKNIKLNNGLEMPLEGFSVAQLADATKVKDVVKAALKLGYRSIDMAQNDHQEAAVSAAIKESGLPHEQLFLTTKVGLANAGAKPAYDSVLRSLQALQTDYLDLVLIHQPLGDYYGTYHALEALYHEHKIRAIGVANFEPDRYVDFVKHVSVTPAINQVEAHVFNQQKFARKWLQKYHTQIEAWGPFAAGKNEFFTNQILTKIGEDYGKTAAQVGLRFLVQENIIVNPKSVHPKRLAENLGIWDFELSDEDMERIRNLDEAQTFFNDHHDPAFVEELSDLKL